LSSGEGRGHRIVNEALESEDDTQEIMTEKSVVTAVTESILTLEAETMNNEILRETSDYPKHTTRDQEKLTDTSTEVSRPLYTLFLSLSAQLLFLFLLFFVLFFQSI
jgi:hypothetical protein